MHPVDGSGSERGSARVPRPERAAPLERVDRRRAAPHQPRVAARAADHAQALVVADERREA